MWETHNIFVKLLLTQWDNLYLIKKKKSNGEKHIHDLDAFDEYSNDINNVPKYTENSNIKIYNIITVYYKISTKKISQKLTDFFIHGKSWIFELLS